MKDIDPGNVLWLLLAILLLVFCWGLVAIGIERLIWG